MKNNVKMEAYDAPRRYRKKSRHTLNAALIKSERAKGGAAKMAPEAHSQENSSDAVQRTTVYR